VDLRRVRASDWAAGLFGAALIGLLWAPWYRTALEGVHFNRSVNAGPVTVYFDRVTLNAWQSMAVNDVIFLIAGLLGIWVLVATATQSTGAVPIAADVFASLVGLIASVLALIRLIWPPDLGPGPTDRAVGVWLGAAATIAMRLAALASMHSERRSEAVEVPATTLPAPRGSSA
jgi:hypothetical protein